MSSTLELSPNKKKYSPRRSVAIISLFVVVSWAIIMGGLSALGLF